MARGTGVDRYLQSPVGGDQEESTVAEARAATDDVAVLSDTTGPRPQWPSQDPYRLVGIAVSILGGLYLVLLLRRSFFYVDDFYRFSEASVYPLSWKYLSLSVFGHFVPGWRFVFWVLQREAPFNYSWAIAITAVIQAFTLFFLHRLLTALFGQRWLNPVLVAMYAFSPALMLSVSWFSNTLHVMPSLLCVLIVCDSFVRYLASDNRRHLVPVLVVAPLGLLFYEKTVFLLLILPLLVVLIHTEDGFRHGLVTAGRRIGRLAPIWVGLVVPMALYFGYTFGHHYYTSKSRPSLGLFARATAKAWTHGVGTSLIGGPFHWHYDYPGYGLPRPSAWAIGLALTVLVAAILLSAGLHSGSWRGWGFAGICFVGSFYIVAFGRLADYGSAIGDNLAYTSDTLPFVLIGVAFAFLPVKSGVFITAGIGAAAGDVLASERARQASWTRVSKRRREIRRRRRVLATGALALYGVASGYSIFQFSQTWDRAVPRDYIHGLLSSIDQLNKTHQAFSLVDLDVPLTVELPGYPINLLSSVLHAARPNLVYDDASNPLYVADERTGHLLRARFIPAGRQAGQTQFPPTASDGHEGRCVLPGLSTVRIDFPARKSDGLRYVWLQYATAAESSLQIILDTPSGQTQGLGPSAVLALPAGSHDELLRITPFDYTHIDLRLSASQPFCISTVFVAEPLAIP